MKIITICLFLQSLISTNGKECTTPSGDCLFPFTYRGTHKICTFVDTDIYPKPWCYVKNGGWDYCSDDCFDCGVSNDLGNSCKMQKAGSEGYFDNAVFPWHVRIVNINNQQVLCNGVILNNDHVLTTASCKGFYHQYGIIVYAGAGVFYYDSGYQDGYVKSFVAHEGYNPRTGENNLAIIGLRDRLVWNDRVLPICFTDDYLPIQEGQSATFSGSYIYNTGSFIPYVHFSVVKKLPEHTDRDCQKNDLFCTTKNSVSYLVNQGGPLTICQDSKRCILVGILSGINENKKFLVFTNISGHVNWIYNHI
ncbi:granzyme B(G,H) isoform X1 [Lepeophtheirus salmonis]|nr:ovochymase-2-like isoform X1 [Lepeophtheirus salmonis]